MRWSAIVHYSFLSAEIWFQGPGGEKKRRKKETQLQPKSMEAVLWMHVALCIMLVSWGPVFTERFNMSPNYLYPEGIEVHFLKNKLNPDKITCPKGRGTWQKRGYSLTVLWKYCSWRRILTHKNMTQSALKVQKHSQKEFWWRLQFYFFIYLFPNIPNHEK